MQILEKLLVADHLLTNLIAKADQQQEHLAVISVEVDKQHAELSAKTDQQQEQLATISAKIDQLNGKVEKQISTIRSRLL